MLCLFSSPVRFCFACCFVPLGTASLVGLSISISSSSSLNIGLLSITSYPLSSHSFLNLLKSCVVSPLGNCPSPHQLRLSLFFCGGFIFLFSCDFLYLSYNFFPAIAPTVPTAPTAPIAPSFFNKSLLLLLFSSSFGFFNLIFFGFSFFAENPYSSPSSITKSSSILYIFSSSSSFGFFNLIFFGFIFL